MNNFTDKFTDKFNNNLFLHHSTKKDILELLISLITYGHETNMWNHKIIQLVNALISVLDEKRANNEIILNTESLAFYLDLKNLIELYKDNKNLSTVKEDLHSYLFSLPQLNIEDDIIAELPLEQHQYISSEIIKVLKIVKQIENMHNEIMVKDK